MDMKVAKDEQTIEALQAETIRLLDAQKELLEEIKVKAVAEDDAGGELHSTSRSGGQFTEKAVDAKVAQLDEHRHKVETLDMVLAVVGTMKAGKSTCINAIVGREILPNRNRPMTALPTLIRHVPGQTVPLLHFDEKRQEPIKDLLVELRKKLQKIAEPESHPRISADKDLLALAREIRGQFELATSYEGEEGIFTFLKELNDLVRLSKELGLQFPFSKYSSVEDFPSIDVEFFHLVQSGSKHVHSQFALLDTPGFNEAGQAEVLLPLLQEQLSKATAVLAVLDYTQLKSESEARLREELDEISAFAADRMFVLVNKFDEKTVNGDDEAETRKYVANSLLGKLFGGRADVGERIFPVSGQTAYLVKRAELEIHVHGQIRWCEGQPESWVDNFGKRAFGAGNRFKKMISDRDEVIEVCQELWAESLFDQPLKHAIRYSHRNAARMAIQAATAKLNEVAHGQNGDGGSDGVESMLALRLQGLQADKEQIDNLIAELDAGLRRLNAKKGAATRQLDNVLEATSEQIDRHLNAVTKEILRQIRQVLKGGESEATAGSVASAFRHFFATASVPKQVGIDGKRGKIRIDELPDVMKFESASAAKSKLNEISKAIKSYLDDSTDSVEETMTTVYGEFVEKLKEFGTDISQVASEFQEHAGQAGFDGLKFKIPRVKTLRVLVETDSDATAIIKDTSRTVTRRREQSGAWGWLKRKADVFGSGWGTDDYRVTESEFQLTKQDLLAYYETFIKRHTTQLKALVHEKFSEPLNAGKDEYFEQINTVFTSIRESMKSSQADQNKTMEERTEFARELELLQAKFADTVDDLRHLTKNAKRLVNA